MADELEELADLNGEPPPEPAVEPEPAVALLPDEPAPPVADDLIEPPPLPAPPAPAPELPPGNGRPRVTFMGNSYDLAALGAVASAALLLFLCVTCNMGFYCLPAVPLVLGLIGLLAARQAVDAQRTRLWSWIGVGTGAFLLILLIVGFLLYIGFIVWLVMNADNPMLQAFSAGWRVWPAA